MDLKNNKLEWKILKKWQNEEYFYSILKYDEKLYFLKKSIQTKNKIDETIKNELKIYNQIKGNSFAPKLIYYNLSKNYILYEYIDGVSIQKIKDKTYKKFYLLQLADAINLLHSKKIIHCDIKPANILISKNKLYLIDYGISKFVGEKNFSGTIRYCSVEQLKKENASEWFDIYALGILIYELFTNKKAYQNMSKSKIIQMKESKSILDEDCSLPKELKNIILKATTQKKEQRYQNIVELKKDLENIFNLL